MKKKDQFLASDQTPRSQPRESDWSTILCMHYPYRSWCRHCTRGRGASRPHRKRSEEDREFSKGRLPTISLDHCLLGSEDQGSDGEAVPARENPFFIDDVDSEAIYCLPGASKAVTDYVVYCVKSVIDLDIARYELHLRATQRQRSSRFGSKFGTSERPRLRRLTFQPRIQR